MECLQTASQSVTIPVQKENLLNPFDLYESMKINSKSQIKGTKNPAQWRGFSVGLGLLHGL